jgi:hypothetical protein
VVWCRGHAVSLYACPSRAPPRLGRKLISDGLGVSSGRKSFSPRVCTCMRACGQACMHACMPVCLHVHMYICTYIYTARRDRAVCRVGRGRAFLTTLIKQTLRVKLADVTVWALVIALHTTIGGGGNNLSGDQEAAPLAAKAVSAPMADCFLAESGANDDGVPAQIRPTPTKAIKDCSKPQGISELR